MAEGWGISSCFICHFSSPGRSHFSFAHCLLSCCQVGSSPFPTPALPLVNLAVPMGLRTFARCSRAWVCEGPVSATSLLLLPGSSAILPVNPGAVGSWEQKTIKQEPKIAAISLPLTMHPAHNGGGGAAAAAPAQPARCCSIRARFRGPRLQVWSSVMGLLGEPVPAQCLCSSRAVSEC